MSEKENNNHKKRKSKRKIESNSFINSSYQCKIDEIPNLEIDQDYKKIGHL
jgi:hypothetical protein